MEKTTTKNIPVFCEYCKKEIPLTKNKKCQVNRFDIKKTYVWFVNRRIKIGGLNVCSACYEYYRRNHTFTRKRKLTPHEIRVHACISAKKNHICKELKLQNKYGGCETADDILHTIGYYRGEI